MRILSFIFICFIVLSFPDYSQAAKNETTKEVKVRIAKNSPKMTLLGRKFVSVGDALLPENLTTIRTNWTDMLKRHDDSVFDVKNIPLPTHHKQQWANLKKLIKKTKGPETLRNVNGFFNSIPSQKDAANYKTTEYWATPYEFLKKRAGDCEDYALAKYFALQYFSWSANNLWVVFLRDNINDGLHVVLAARYQDKVFILDNLSKPVHLLIPEAQYAGQVKVVALFNHQGMWLPIRESS